MSMFSPTLPSSHTYFPPSSPCFSSRVFASFARRSRSRRRNKIKHSPLTTTNTTYSEPILEAVIDLTLFPSFHSNIRQFVSSGKEAYRDLQTLFTLDANRRVIVSCRPSTLHFVGTSAALTLVAFSVLRVLVELVSRLTRGNASSYNDRTMVRRDRSLGGKEVVVGLGHNNYNNTTASIKRSFKNKVAVQRKLPKWWPINNNNNNNLNSFDFDLNEQEEYKREAYRLLRGLSFLFSFFTCYTFLPFD